jgi:glyceraldehyde 3-phosphate dehydrogenase
LTVKIGINGFGRIGRTTSAPRSPRAPTSRSSPSTTHGQRRAGALLKFDSITGRLDATVELDGDSIVVDGKPIKVLAERDPANLPGASWASTSSSNRPASSRRPKTRASTSRPAPRRS